MKDLGSLCGICGSTPPARSRPVVRFGCRKGRSQAAVATGIGNRQGLFVTESRSQDDKPVADAVSPRFDAAHPAAGGHTGEGLELPEPAVPAPALLAAVAGKSDVAADQLQQQAGELADHLRRRQHELGRRESVLNARSAVYDDQQRSARLWLREQQLDLESRESALRRQQEELKKQARSRQESAQTAQTLARERQLLGQARHAVEMQQRQLATELENVQHQADWLLAARESWHSQCREEQRTFDRLRAQLLEQQQAAEEMRARLQARLAECQRDERLQQQMEERQRRLEIESVQLQEQRAHFEQARLELEHDRELWRARTAQQRQSIAAQCRRQRQELQQLREAVQRRQRALDDQAQQVRDHQKSVAQQRRELAQRQIVLDHAIAMVQRQVAPDDFSHLQQAVKRFVEAQVKEAAQSVDTHKAQLHELAASLQQQQEILKLRHARFQSQMARRQRELDSQRAVE